MLIILDRDGVINHESLNYVRSPEEWLPIAGSLAAVARLNQAGYQVVIATNQSGIARRYYTTDMLEKIHDKMKRNIAHFGGKIDAIYFCPHLPEHGCECRKPGPGMLLQAMKDFNRSHTETIFIGDSYTDLEAAWSIGCRAVLVKTGNGMTALQSLKSDDATPVYNNLAHAVHSLLYFGLDQGESSSQSSVLVQ